MTELIQFLMPTIIIIVFLILFLDLYLLVRKYLKLKIAKMQSEIDK